MVKIESEAVIELEGGATKQAWQLKGGDQLAGGGAVLTDALATYGELERVTFKGDGFSLRVPLGQAVALGEDGKRNTRLRSMGSCSTLTLDRSSLPMVDKDGKKRLVTFVSDDGR